MTILLKIGTVFDYCQFTIFLIRKALRKSFSEYFILPKVLDLVILDDCFPSLFSPFRVSEYNQYLKIFRNSAVLTTSRDFWRSLFDYEKLFVTGKTKVQRFDFYKKINAKLGYVMFLDLASEFLPFFKKNSIPFVVGLYAGGGFGINNSISDAKLKRISRSPLFRGFIVTHNTTLDYLVSKGFCPKKRILYVHGGVPMVDYFKKNKFLKQYFPRDKKTIDICFVANRNMKLGLDKGYDVFTATAKILSKKFNNVMFHVVGKFSAEEIDVSEIRDKITFYGKKSIDFFPKFYSKMDIVLAPHRPNVLYKGAFDGFPGGSCSQASSAGVAVFVSDYLEQNESYEDRKDIVIVNHNPLTITKLISYYIDNVNKLYDLSRKGKRITYEYYSDKIQMVPRVRYLRSLIKE